MKKTYLRVLLTLLLFVIFSQESYARDISISANKNSLLSEEDLMLTASISGFLPEETIYLKGAFFQDTTSNYFGYTKYNNDWIKNSASSTSQRQVKIGEWDLQTIVKNDSLDSGFKGSGGYKLKLGYYYVTSGGNLSAVNWSTNSIDVALVAPSATPTIVPSASNTATPTKTPTPTVTQAVTVIPSSTVTKVVTSSKVAVKPTKKIQKAEVLGSANREALKTSPTNFPNESKNSFIMPPIFLILGVLVIILACGILLFQEWKKQKTLEL